MYFQSRCTSLFPLPPLDAVQARRAAGALVMRPVGTGDKSDERLRQEKATAGMGTYVAIHITLD